MKEGKSLPAAGVATAAPPLAAAGAATAPPAGMEANLERPVEGEDNYNLLGSNEAKVNMSQ